MKRISLIIVLLACTAFIAGGCNGDAASSTDLQPLLQAEAHYAAGQPCAEQQDYAQDTFRYLDPADYAGRF
ncbi:MAG: hypothetical protein ACLFVU_09635 [Phycisphaerae bacterium]